MSDSIYSFWLLSEPILTPGNKRKIYEYFGDAYHVYFASENDIYRSNSIPKESVYEFVSARDKFDLEKKYEEFVHSPFSYVTLEDQSYPQKLRLISSSPYGFYYNGALPDQDKKHIAMVGARDCSGYGKNVALELAKALTKEGYVIVSGMAKGIDTYAHMGALEANGQTIAVLGCGADVVYPRCNAPVYNQIVKSGAVISEYRMSSQPLPAQFPQRNRIISGLCDTTIVIEAKEKSGSLITADFALEQGRDVYVVPGRIGDSLSGGCNRLIAQGAGIITSIDQFVSELREGTALAGILLEQEKQKCVELSGKEALVLSSIDYYPRDINYILNETGIAFLEIIGLLSSLQKKGLIKEVFKNQYVIVGVMER